MSVVTRKRELREDEHALWQEVMRDVHRPRRRRKTATGHEKTKIKQAAEKPAAKIAAAPVKPAVPTQIAKVVRAVPGLDGSTADRLRRGKVEPEATLDLHGMTQATAHGRLVTFIRRSSDAAKRCVLVVTGKGTAGRPDPDGGAAFVMSGPTRGGVLQAMVPRWLQEGDVKSMVSGVQTANPKHGGDGALYVYLRRRKGV